MYFRYIGGMKNIRLPRNFLVSTRLHYRFFAIESDASSFRCRHVSDSNISPVFNTFDRSSPWISLVFLGKCPESLHGSHLPNPYLFRIGGMSLYPTAVLTSCHNRSLSLFGLFSRPGNRSECLKVLDQVGKTNP